VFDDLVELLPTGGRALDVACGRGPGSVWIAQRGLDVFAVDVSAVAVDFARQHVNAMGVGGRCKFAVVDLNDGLPAGPPVELVLSYLYWTPELTRPLVERLAPGGLLAVCHVSEADVGPGEWRIPVGSLRKAFAAIDQLEIIDDRETDGMARILACRRRSPCLYRACAPRRVIARPGADFGSSVQGYAALGMCHSGCCVLRSTRESRTSRARPA
jgi:SAM-dependent methyltransferase